VGATDVRGKTASATSAFIETFSVRRTHPWRTPHRHATEVLWLKPRTNPARPKFRGGAITACGSGHGVDSGVCMATTEAH